MAEQFEFRDLSDGVFWGADLQRARFRDVDLMGARISHSRLVDVVIDAEIDRLIVNGVDVTAYVNERDPWFALRSQLHPSDPAHMRDGWRAFEAVWEDAIARAWRLTEGQRRMSVDGEWSFVQTIRHLVFATDKWFTVPILGGTFHPVGIPNSGSVDFGWPGLDAAADPTFEVAVAAWRERSEGLHRYLGDIEAGALSSEVPVLENGASAVHDCIGIVFEEHFQHLRYALRDLDRLQ